MPPAPVGSPGTITAAYYLSTSVTVEASFVGSGIFPSVELRSTAAGASFLGTVIQGTELVLAGLELLVLLAPDDIALPG